MFVTSLLFSGALPGGVCAGSTSAVEHDSHDVVSECGAGPSAAGLVLHDLEGSLLESNGALVMRDCVGRRRSRSASTAGGDLAHATAGDAKGIIGLLERSVSQSSCLNSDNSSMGVCMC